MYFPPRHTTVWSTLWFKYCCFTQPKENHNRKLNPKIVKAKTDDLRFKILAQLFRTDVANMTTLTLRTTSTTNSFYSPCAGYLTYGLWFWLTLRHINAIISKIFLTVRLRMKLTGIFNDSILFSIIFYIILTNQHRHSSAIISLALVLNYTLMSI